MGKPRILKCLLYVSTGTTTDTQSIDYHASTCDVCNFPIIGVRWKCLNCSDYGTYYCFPPLLSTDICTGCENLFLTVKQHNVYHSFAKLHFPLSDNVDVCLGLFTHWTVQRSKLHIPNLYTCEMEDETERTEDSEEDIIKRRQQDEDKIPGIPPLFVLPYLLYSHYWSCVGQQEYEYHSRGHFLCALPAPHYWSEILLSSLRDPTQLVRAGGIELLVVILTIKCESVRDHPVHHVFLKINFSLPSTHAHLRFTLPPIYEKFTKKELRDSGSRRKAKVGTFNKPPENNSGNIPSLPKLQGTPLQQLTLISPAYIRPMTKYDIPYIMEIERESFFSPYSHEFFYRFRKCPGEKFHLNFAVWLTLWYFYVVHFVKICASRELSSNYKNRLTLFLGCAIFVAETEDQPVGGYIACSVKREDVQIFSLAVGVHSRRRGLGQLLLRAGMEYGLQYGCTQVFFFFILSTWRYFVLALFKHFLICLIVCILLCLFCFNNGLSFLNVSLTLKSALELSPRVSD